MSRHPLARWGDFLAISLSVTVTSLCPLDVLPETQQSTSSTHPNRNRMQFGDPSAGVHNRKKRAQRSERRIVEMLNLVFDGFNVGHDDEIVARRSLILTT